MSLRISIVHKCHDQEKVLAYIEPLLHLPITKQELMDLWDQSARALGETRPKNCRCNFRVTMAEADELVRIGVASYLITDWRYNEEKKVFFPAPNPNLVWGGKQAEELGLVRSSLAAKTPRVMTIERANLERAYIGTKQYPKGDPDEQARIEYWGQLAREVISALTIGYWPEPYDPFKGKPVLSVPPGWDQRTCVGKDKD